MSHNSSRASTITRLWAPGAMICSNRQCFWFVPFCKIASTSRHRQTGMHLKIKSYEEILSSYLSRKHKTLTQAQTYIYGEHLHRWSPSKKLPLEKEIIRVIFLPSLPEQSVFHLQKPNQVRFLFLQSAHSVYFWRWKRRRWPDSYCNTIYW